MSWDVAVSVHEEVVVTRSTLLYERDVTWNNGPIFYQALGCSFRDLHGRRGGAVLPLLEQAIADLEGHSSTYRPLEPENGWGGIADALEVLHGMRTACREHPESRIEIR